MEPKAARLLKLGMTQRKHGDGDSSPSHRKLHHRKLLELKTLPEWLSQRSEPLLAGRFYNFPVKVDVFVCRLRRRGKTQPSATCCSNDLLISCVTAGAPLTARIGSSSLQVD